ncbi:MAG: hypothetical protein VYE73_03375 [Acidobacteriota bacterium]|nr:hypothetical protein [Acidobacteriota bacterium]
MSELQVELEGSLDEALEAVGEAADLWGGEWQRLGTGGQLILPVSAGIRHGHIAGQLSTKKRSGQVELELFPERTYYRVHLPSLMVLLFGAIGGLFIVVVPFFPALFPLVPAGILLSIAAWFLVVARLKTRGVSEFFELVRDLVETPPGPPEGA